MDGPSRIRRWAQVVYNGNISADWGRQTEITETAAWAAMDSTICSELSDMLGFRFEPAAADDALDGSTFAAQLPLSISSEQSELCLAVGIDDATAAILAEAMFGSPTSVSRSSCASRRSVKAWSSRSTFGIPAERSS